MKVIVDLDEIRELSRSREGENWAFIEFLRENSNNFQLQDLIAESADAAFDIIDCTQCGNCCRENLPLLTDTDIARISGHLHMNRDEFESQYLHYYRQYDVFLMNRVPCPFLEGKRCTVYEARFDSCRAYPEIRELRHILAKGNIMKNMSVCPIIFNFYEILKEKTGYIYNKKIT